MRVGLMQGRPMVTEGGLETDLIFHHGVALPHFAAFPLLDSDRGRALPAGYYDGYAAIARRPGAGLVLESPTWGATPGWERGLRAFSPLGPSELVTSAVRQQVFGKTLASLS